MSDDTYAMGVLIEDMKAEDTEIRIKAMQKLKIVAAALGPERTRSQLIPYLNERVEDDDEVLLVMSEQLGDFVRFVGGPAHAAVLMQPLGALATAEETVVREKAVDSAAAVISVLNPEQVMESVVPVLQRLTGGDWFTARVSACGLFKGTYERLADPDTKRILRSLFVTLSTDDTPMVRRAAAKAVGSLAGVVEHEHVVSELVPVFHSLASEEPDSVRLLAVEGCTAFARVLSPAENAAHVLPLVASCSRDKSWRVRNNIAKEFAGLAAAVGEAAARSDLLHLFVALLKDPEAEVRASAARCVAQFSKLIGPEAFLSSVLPAVDQLSAADSPAAVKTAVAEAVMELPSLVSLPVDAAARSLVPLIDRLLVDEANEVKLKVLEGIPHIASSGALTSKYLEEGVLPMLEKLGQDPLWRVRERVIDQLPLLVHTLGKLNERLMQLFLNTYVDQVHAVRMAGTRATQRLALAFGPDWVRSTLVPHLRELFTAQGASYLQRLTVLHALRDLLLPEEGRPGAVPGSPLAVVAEDVLPILIGAMTDAVPNVRFVAAQVLQRALEAGVYAPARVQADIMPALTAAAGGDKDIDVRYFAGCAVEAGTNGRG